MSGDFLDPARWQGGLVPGSSDKAVFHHSVPYVVGFSGDATVDKVAVTGNKEFTLDLEGNALAIVNPGYSLHDGLAVGGASGQTAEATLVNGTLSLGRVSVGLASGGHGLLNLDGVAASAVRPISIGEAGDGLLRLRNGSTLNLANPSSLTIGNGALEVLEGSTLTTDNTVHVDASPAQPGRLSVVGAGSRLDFTTPAAGGHVASGIVEILGGGRIEGHPDAAPLLTFAGTANKLIVSGLGSTLAGSLRTADDGSLVDVEITAGASTRGINAGQGSLLVSAATLEGFLVARNVLIEAGGYVKSSVTNVNEAIVVRDSTLEVSNDVYGDLHLWDSHLLTSAVTLHDRVVGNGMLAGQIDLAGLFSPGGRDAVDVLTVIGSVHFNAVTGAKLEVDLFGNEVSDLVAISGAATLAGEVDFNLAENAVLIPGESYPLLTYGSSTGAMRFAEPTPLQLVPLANGLVLYVPLPGDANADGQVSGADYTIWADHYFPAGTEATFAEGDFNSDGLVTGADFTLWADNFGQMVAPPRLDPAPIPEPATVWLASGAAAGGIAWSWARRRQRRTPGG